jgi:hypothetical protein
MAEAWTRGLVVTVEKREKGRRKKMYFIQKVERKKEDQWAGGVSR